MRRTATLVRCLECGTEYRLEPEPRGGEAGPCPSCGGVGWITLDAGRREEKNS